MREGICYSNDFLQVLGEAIGDVGSLCAGLNAW